MVNQNEIIMKLSSDVAVLKEQSQYLRENIKHLREDYEERIEHLEEENTEFKEFKQGIENTGKNIIKIGAAISVVTSTVGYYSETIRKTLRAIIGWVQS